MLKYCILKLWNYWRKTNRKYDNLLITDKNTGERIVDGEAVYLTIRTEKQVEALKTKKQKEEEKEQEDNKKYSTIPIKTYFKGNVEEIKLLMNELEPYEKVFLFSVAPYVGFEDCCLKSGNNVELSFEKMMEVSGISKGKLSEILQSLRKKDIIYKGNNSKNVQYFVNPWLFNKGNRFNKVLKTMFKNYGIRTMNNVKWKDLKE